jgi:hypothetical protein
MTEQIKIKQMKDIWEWGRCFCPIPLPQGEKCLYCGGFIKEEDLIKVKKKK